MKKLLCLLAFSLFLLSCKKDMPLECVDSIVFWGGDPAADGMGWYLADSRGSANSYIITSMPAEFQADSTPVKVCLFKAGKWRNCYCTDPPPVYRIISISRR